MYFIGLKLSNTHPPLCVVYYLFTTTHCHTAYDYTVRSVNYYVYTMYMSPFLFLPFLLYCLLQYYCSLAAVMKKFPVCRTNKGILILIFPTSERTVQPTGQ